MAGAKWKVFTLWLFLSLVFKFATALEDEVFTEELLLKPLPDGKLLAHFHFTSTLPPGKQLGAHHHLFPKSIAQLVKKYHIREMDLSFTQGRWNYIRWGGSDPVAQAGAKPVGVELTAAFDVPQNQVGFMWGNLTHALSGLFCASINFLESPTTVSDPIFSFRPEADWLFRSETGISHIDAKKELKEGRHLRYGALPREAVCTENLTPWLKLLPCRDKAGIAALLDRPRIYKGFYHSMQLKITTCNGSTCAKYGVKLQQTLTVVMSLADNPIYNRHSTLEKRENPFSWSLESIFGTPLVSSCPLVNTSNVYIELHGDVMSKLEAKCRHIKAESGDLDAFKEISLDIGNKGTVEEGCNIFENNLFSLRSVPHRVMQSRKHGMDGYHSVLIAYDITKHSAIHPLNAGILWKEPITWSSFLGPLRATRFLIGRGNARGSIAIVLRNNNSTTLRRAAPCKSTHGCFQVKKENIDSNECNDDLLDVMIFQMIPWYVHLYGHTLQLTLDGKIVDLRQSSLLTRYVPAEHKSPAIMEIALRIPANTMVATLAIEFDKGFLHIDEYPADANRGFDLPSAVISFPGCQTMGNYNEANTTSPFIESLMGKEAMRIYTETLLMPLPTPDFSMPYNVITLTCTLLAVYFGSLLNILRRRSSEEEQRNLYAQGLSTLKERLSKFAPKYGLIGKTSIFSTRFSKLYKAVLVVGAAILIHYILNST